MLFYLNLLPNTFWSVNKEEAIQNKMALWVFFCHEESQQWVSSAPADEWRSEPQYRGLLNSLLLMGADFFDMYMSYGWGGLLVKRDVRMSHDVTSDRHTTWRQTVTRRNVRPSHDGTSDRHTTWRQTVTRRKRLVNWLLNAITHNAHHAARISQYDNSHPVPIRCFWILLEFRNTIVRVQSRVIRDMIFGR